MAVAAFGFAPVPHKQLRPLRAVASVRLDPQMRSPAARPAGMRTLTVRRLAHRSQARTADRPVTHANDSTAKAEALRPQSQPEPRTWRLSPRAASVCAWAGVFGCRRSRLLLSPRSGIGALRWHAHLARPTVSVCVPSAQRVPHRLRGRQCG